MSEHLIVKARDVLRLEAAWRRWRALAAGLGVLTGILAGLLAIDASRQEELRQHLATMQRLQVRQDGLETRLEAAWQHQLQTAELLITWGRYIKDRAEARAANQGLPLDPSRASPRVRKLLRTQEE